jgi:hypothetical protein
MENSLETTPSPLFPTSAPGKPPIRRIIAHYMKLAGKENVDVQAMGKRMSYRKYLGIMLWDAATMGEMYFADGTKVQITDFKDWLDLVKYMSNHMDGPAVQDATFVGVNVFKVYSGIDDSKV